MKVLSIRLSEEDEKILQTLASYYGKNKSAIIKESLREMYEDMVDKKEIEEFEIREKKGKVKFLSSEEMREKIDRF